MEQLKDVIVGVVATNATMTVRQVFYQPVSFRCDREVGR
jgi:hypothetical protein